jgi:hypothetical protein
LQVHPQSKRRRNDGFGQSEQDRGTHRHRILNSGCQLRSHPRLETAHHYHLAPTTHRAAVSKANGMRQHFSVDTGTVQSRAAALIASSRRELASSCLLLHRSRPTRGRIPSSKTLHLAREIRRVRSKGRPQEGATDCQPASACPRGRRMCQKAAPVPKSVTGDHTGWVCAL